MDEGERQAIIQLRMQQRRRAVINSVAWARAVQLGAQVTRLLSLQVAVQGWWWPLPREACRLSQRCVQSAQVFLPQIRASIRDAVRSRSRHGLAAGLAKNGRQ